MHYLLSSETKHVLLQRTPPHKNYKCRRILLKVFSFSFFLVKKKKKKLDEEKLSYTKVRASRRS